MWLNIYSIGLRPMLLYVFALAIYASEHKPPQPLGLESVNYFWALDKLVKLFNYFFKLGFWSIPLMNENRSLEGAF